MTKNPMKASELLFIGLIVGLLLVGSLQSMDHASAALQDIDVNITVDVNHIKLEDPIEGIWDEADWYFGIAYSTDGKSSWAECFSKIPLVNGDDDLYLSDTDGKISHKVTAKASQDYRVYIKVGLFEYDNSLPDTTDDIADISIETGGGKDNAATNGHYWDLGGAVLHFFINVADSSASDLYWWGGNQDSKEDQDTEYKYSGTADGSSGIDENDASIWLSISDDYIDDTAPMTVATPAGMLGVNGWYTGAVVITLSANDNAKGTGVKATNWRVGGGNWALYVNQINLPNDGIFILDYYSEDYKNIEVTKSTTIDIDQTPPGIPAPDDVVAGWSNVNIPTFSWATVVDATSGVAGYEYQIDNGGWIWIGAINQVRLLPQADGAHTFFIRAKDNAGLIGNIGSHLFQIDTVSPPLPLSLVSDHAIATWSNDSTIDVSWTEPIDANSGLAGYSWIWDTSPITIPGACINDGAGTTTISSLSLLDGNQHYFHIRPVDLAGNWAAGAAHIGPFFIDVTAPNLPTLTSTPATQTWSPTTDIKLTITGASDATSGVDGYWVGWDTLSSTTPLTQKTVSHSVSLTIYTLSGVSDGKNIYVHVGAVDIGGNWNLSAVTSGPYFIDTGKPSGAPTFVETSGHSPGAWINEVSISGTLQGYDEGSGEIDGFLYIWDCLPTTIPTTSGSRLNAGNPLSYEFPQDGDSYYLHALSVDKAGNIGTSTGHFGSYKIDTKKPTCRILTLPNPEPTTVFGLSWSGTDAVPSSGDLVYDVEYRLNGGAWQPVQAATQVKSTSVPFSFGKDGDTVEFRCRATDSAGNMGDMPSEAQASTTIRVDKGAISVLLDGPNGDVASGSSVSLGVSALDGAGAVVAAADVTVAKVGVGTITPLKCVTDSGGMVSLTFTSTETGTADVSVTISKTGYRTGTSNIIITVSEEPDGGGGTIDLLLILSVEPQSILYGQTAQVQVRASDKLSGAPVSDGDVTLSVSPDGTASLSPSVGELGPDGRFTSSFALITQSGLTEIEIIALVRLPDGKSGEQRLIVPIQIQPPDTLVIIEMLGPKTAVPPDQSISVSCKIFLNGAPAQGASVSWEVNSPLIDVTPSVTDTDSYGKATIELRFPKKPDLDIVILTVMVEKAGYTSASQQLYISCLPAVGITEPKEASVVSATFRMEGWAAGSLRRVEYRIDDGDWEIALGTVNWETTVDSSDIENDAHRVDVRALNNQGYSPVVSIIIAVENKPEKPLITSPSSGATVSGSTSIFGLADTSARSIDIQIDDGPWEAIPGSKLWKYTWDTTKVEDGQHTIRIRACSGTIYSDEDQITVDVKNNANPTTVALDVNLLSLLMILIIGITIGTLLVISLRRRGT